MSNESTQLPEPSPVRANPNYRIVKHGTQFKVQEKFGWGLFWFDHCVPYYKRVPLKFETVEQARRYIESCYQREEHRNKDYKDGEIVKYV